MICFFSKATQVSPSELQDVFQETSSNIFQINANGKMSVCVLYFKNYWISIFLVVLCYEFYH